MSPRRRPRWKEKKRAELNLKAVAAEQSALAAEQRSREFRYATDIQLAATLLADDRANAGQVLARLANHDPAANEELQGKDDLRGLSGITSSDCSTAGPRSSRGGKPVWARP